MNKIFITMLSAALLAGCTNTSETGSAELSTEMDSISYAYGQYMAMQIKRTEWDELNPDMIRMAFKDFNEKGDSGMVFEMATASQMLMQYDNKRQGASNKKACDDYLAKNKENEGVVALPSGLQYKVMNTGDGVSPGPSDTVLCNYKGFFLSGKTFDSSEEGLPAKFKVDEVIPGWTEALQLMKTGAKWTLYVPSEMGYGDKGNQVIPPSSGLIFEIELVDVIK